MDDSTASLAAAIGTRVKNERQSKGWTLDRLADATGVSRRMIVNVEQGAANPSVGILLRISDALGVGLPALVEPPQPKPVKVTRDGDGAELWSGANGGSGIFVAGTRPPNVVELWEWTLEPGDSHESDAHTPGTMELIQLHEGVILVTVGNETHRLEAGDAISFPGDESHSYENAGTTRAWFSLCVFEPGVGVAPVMEVSHV